MTLMLIFGAVAAIYMIWILFRLAAHALPVYSGTAAAMLLIERSYSFPAAIAGGLLTGIAVLLLGQILMAFISSPLLRLIVAAIFAVPAGIAGYQLVQGLGPLLIDRGPLLSILSVIGTAAAAVAALRTLAFQLPGEGPAAAPQQVPSPSIPAE